MVNIGISGERMRGPCFYRGKEEIGEGCRGSSLAADGGQLVFAGSGGNLSSCWGL